VLQAADIIIYRANGVPVGKDQLPHIELTREIARRFNFMYKSEIFPIPDGLLTESPVLPGLDGRKMSKSYGNCIFITESEKDITEKISKMMTDPQRIRRNDPGDPEVSPVFAYHKLYSLPGEVARIAEGCRTAAIGCVECKKILIRNVVSRLAPIRERRLKLEGELDDVKQVIAEGNARARRESIITMELVRRAIGI
jgi:tryptophanyl-tRNA synthetase